MPKKLYMENLFQSIVASFTALLATFELSLIIKIDSFKAEGKTGISEIRVV